MDGARAVGQPALRKNGPAGRTNLQGGEIDYLGPVLVLLWSKTGPQGGSMHLFWA
jgi:hypothetical protein